MTAFTTNQDSNGRKRQMFSKIRKRVTYANVAMTLALVFAMTGGAYAAKKYLITSTKQISPSVLKSLVGKTGPAGAQGPAGPAGSQGPAGKDGTNGAPGETGKEGPQGKAGATGPTGKSVATSVASGTECKAGGTKLTVEGAATSSHVCNGEEGKEGALGTAGTTLPSGATETGTWAMEGGEEGKFDAISFPIPLANEMDVSHYEYVASGSGSAEKCESGTAAEPKAAPGYLCVYTRFGEIEFVYGDKNPTSFEFGAGRTGTILVAGAEVVSAGFPNAAGGTWAVTAP